MSAIEQKQLANPPLCNQGLAEIINQLISITTTKKPKYYYQLQIISDLDLYLTTAEKSIRVSLTVFGITRTDSGPHGHETLSIEPHNSHLLALRKKAIMADLMLGKVTPDQFAALSKDSQAFVDREVA